MNGRISFKTLLVLGILTLAISIARLVYELNSGKYTGGGGEQFWLGISWLPPILGLWFGWKLAGAGIRPRSGKMMFVCAILAIGLSAGAGMYFGPQVKEGKADIQTMFQAVMGAMIFGAVLMLATWPRLAATLFTYGLLARVPVVAITWLCLEKGWDTHYVKFGPPEHAMHPASTAEAMELTAMAQFGLWVPYTIVSGTITGAIAAMLRRKPS